MYRLFHHLLLLFLSLTLSGAVSITDPGQIPQEDESIKIGLLIPDHSNPGIIRAAEMAIEEANTLVGGFEGIPFKLVVRTTEGFWGAGSKESVALVYEDKVYAIMGSLDGRNAHLAEQVATKSHITYLETRATEPTLSQAFVPWFFRCVPNDDQQSRTLLEYMAVHGGGRTVILYCDSYDSQMAANSFTRISARMGYPGPELIMINPDNKTSCEFIDQLRNKNIRHLVITFNNGTSREIAREARKKNPALTVYGTHTFTSGMNPEYSFGDDYDGMILISTGSLYQPAGEQFRSDFKKKYGQLPGISSYYAYDGMNLIIEAIRKSGLDREAIKETLAGIRYTEGITGGISFDEFGNRTDPVRFMIVQNEVPVLSDPVSSHLQ